MSAVLPATSQFNAVGVVCFIRKCPFALFDNKRNASSQHHGQHGHPSAGNCPRGGQYHHERLQTMCRNAGDVQGVLVARKSDDSPLTQADLLAHQLIAQKACRMDARHCDRV